MLTSGVEKEENISSQWIYCNVTEENMLFDAAEILKAREWIWSAWMICENAERYAEAKNGNGYIGPAQPFAPGPWPLLRVQAPHKSTELREPKIVQQYVSSHMLES